MARTKFPAREHATQLVKELTKLLPQDLHDRIHVIFLQACPSTCRDDTDREILFHQEANFNYLTGFLSAAASVCITFCPNQPGITHRLLIPPANPLETLWSVPPPTLEDSREWYDSDEIRYTGDMDDIIDKAKRSLEASSTFLHTLPMTQEYPPLPEKVLDSTGVTGKATIFQHCDEYLLKALHLARLTKTTAEIELIREACRISSGAHEVVMRELGRYAKKRALGDIPKQERTGKEAPRDWEVESEGDAEAVFVAACRRSGANQAYLPIVASGIRASTLHYVCNDRLFPAASVPRQPGDTSFTPQAMGTGCCGSASDHSHDSSAEKYHGSAFQPQVLLIDAGCEVQGYASDITRTIPVGNGGKYTEKAGQIYETVLRMQKECEAIIKPGIHWDTIHLHAHRVLIENFLKFGIFEGDAEEILQSGITAAFYPHGLGHSLGLDVHDSRQYLKSTHIELPAETASTPAKLYTYLRIRQPLQANMVLTVEPGCYFPPQLMEEHGIWDSPFVNTKKLKEYQSVGGVRIEDVVLVTETGCENLTTVGRERVWVEEACSGL